MDKRRLDGLSSHCRVCRAGYVKPWADRNREKLRIKNRLWMRDYNRRPDQVHARKTKYLQRRARPAEVKKDQERARAYQKTPKGRAASRNTSRRRYADPKKYAVHLARVSRWKKRNPEKLRAYSRAARERLQDGYVVQAASLPKGSPQSLIDFCRELIRYRRLRREQKQQQQGTNENSNKHEGTAG
jgi:hypothetical protein